jgi:hypothetical protein
MRERENERMREEEEEEEEERDALGWFSLRVGDGVTAM